VLGDDAKRGRYDQFGFADGADPNQNGFGGGGNPFGGGGFHAQGMDINDLFEELFTGRRRGPRRGQNMQYSLRLSFLEAVHGCTKDLTFQFQARGPDGRPKQETRNAKIEVPAGVETGMTMQVSGEGADGDPGMPRGDLYVQIEVAEDRYFRRDPRRAEDVHVEVPVSAVQAALGAKLDVVTLDGMVELKIPPGSQPGATLLMRNKGIERVQRPGRGNQYVHLQLTVPRKLTDKQKDLYEQLLAEETGSGSGGAAGAGDAGGGGKKEKSAFELLCDFTLKKIRNFKEAGDKAA